MPDPAHIETDRLLEELEAEVSAIYEQAALEMRGTAESYLDYYRETDRALFEAYAAGEISKEEYVNRRMSHLYQANWYRQMSAVLAEDMIHANQIAASIINGYLPEVYAINHNFATYDVEHQAKVNTNYTLYDRQTVERLIRDHPDLIPMEALVKIPESERWNKTIVSSLMTQSIVQGEDIPTTAKRISDNLPTRNRNAAIRDARTMTTSAQNGGREDAYKRAADMGLQFEERWVATLDGRTRHAHRQLDGQIKPVGGTFHVDGYDIAFPGDPYAPAYLLYNCRCTTLSKFKSMNLPNSFDGAFGYSRGETLGDITYKEWKADKGDSPFSKKARNQKSDYKQYEEYKKLIPRKQMPGNFKDFQTMKYEKRKEWVELKREAARQRYKRRNEG